MNFSSNLVKILAPLCLPLVLILSNNPAQAGLTSDALKVAIQSKERPEQATTNNRQKSLYYVRKGLEVQQESPERAAMYYEKALELDNTNPWVFVATGYFLGENGDTANGAKCMRAAVYLAQEQRDGEAYQIATEWLEAQDL
jgi:tetratricopeptide (TPR) repeat protein